MTSASFAYDRFISFDRSINTRKYTCRARLTFASQISLKKI
jgi:hypothetical protein